MDVASLFVCPSCGNDGLEPGSRALTCPACKQRFARNGYVDLFDTATKGEPTPATTEQRLMESELVARLYERVWRPNFVRLMAELSGLGAHANEIVGFESVADVPVLGFEIDAA